MSKPNGWKAQSARNGKPPEPIIWTPSEWEELLRKLSLSESQAAQIVTGFENDHLAKLLRLWIRDHYQRRFIPEPILESLGLAVVLP